MYKVPAARAWWPAVGAQLEREVRPHTARHDSAAGWKPVIYEELCILAPTLGLVERLTRSVLDGYVQGDASCTMAPGVAFDCRKQKRANPFAATAFVDEEVVQDEDPGESRRGVDRIQLCEPDRRDPFKRQEDNRLPVIEPRLKERASSWKVAGLALKHSVLIEQERESFEI